MAFKDFLTIVSGVDEEAAFAAAEVLAGSSAHVTVLKLTELPPPITSPYGADLWADATAKIREDAVAERGRVATRLQRFSKPADLKSAEVMSGTTDDIVGYYGRHADLIIMQRSGAPVLAQALEAALFKSGRPLLLIPPQWRAATIGRRILVAWNGKREAARAVADAMPFLEGADRVVVATVDAKPAFDVPVQPGADIVDHLKRCGVPAELRNVDGLGRSAEEALVEEARAIDADVIVMGGYGHSRFREFVFGGVTRALTETAPTPLFLSH
jgi:nucleotide-binding universal stress UspA family protein